MKPNTIPCNVAIPMYKAVRRYLFFAFFPNNLNLSSGSLYNITNAINPPTHNDIDMKYGANPTP